MEIAGDSYAGEVASSDIDASVYESHVSHISHASSLHSTTRSTAIVPPDARPDFDFSISNQLSASDAAIVIAAAAGRMLWQQAYHVDYLASSIISHFWRSRQQRFFANNQRQKLAQLKQLERHEIDPVQARNCVQPVEQALLALHAAMARAVWRQGYLIDYTASSIIAHTWRNLKKKRAIVAEEVQLPTLAPVEPIVDTLCWPHAPETAIKMEGNNEIAPPNSNKTPSSTAEAAVTDEASNVFKLLPDAAGAASSYLPSIRAPSAASKKTFGALLRASKTGELGKLLGVTPEEKGTTADEDQLANREALIVTAIASVLGDSTSLPREVVEDLLVQSGIFMASAAEVMAQHLKAIRPSYMQASLFHESHDVFAAG